MAEKRIVRKPVRSAKRRPVQPSQSSREYYDVLKAKAHEQLREIVEEIAGKHLEYELGDVLYFNPPFRASQSQRSLHFDLSTGLFTDWGADVHGDIIQFVEYMQNGGKVTKHIKGQPLSQSHVQARDWLAKRVGMPPFSGTVTNLDTRRADKEKIARERLYGILGECTDYYHLKALENNELLAWAGQQWGLTVDDFVKFRIGYSDNQDVKDHLMEQCGFSEADVLSTGLYTNAGRAGRKNPFFRCRLIFPYISDGRVVYLSGRTTPWTPEHEKQKYKNLMLWQDQDGRRQISKWLTNDYFFNEDAVRNALYYIVFTEGVTDAISLDRIGIPALAMSTVSFSNRKKQHLLDLAMRVSTVYVCNDNEIGGAGIKGAFRTGATLEQAGVNVRIMTLPRPDGCDKFDTCDYINSGHTRDDFEALMVMAKRPLEMQIDSVDNTISESDKHEIAANLMHEIAKLPPSSQEPYLKQLKKKLGVSTMWARQQFAVIQANMSDHKRLTLQASARLFHENFGPFIYVNGGLFFRYERGLWSEAHEDTMNSMADKHLEKYAKGKRKGNIGVRDRDEICRKTAVLDGVFMGDIESLNPNRGLLNLQNGMFDVESGQLQEHAERHLSTVQLPYSYDPAATCPRWEQFIEEVLPDDIEARHTIQEWFGYCLTTETKYAKALIVTGEGSNGKSVMLKILAELVGKKNYSSLRLSEFNERFKVGDLMYKLVNIASENEGRVVSDSAMFKAIVSGDPITAERKFKDPISFRPYVKLCFSTNNLSRFNDTSFALQRRLMIINFNRTFSGHTDDKDLEKTLMCEIPGIFNWSLTGYERLRRHGDFTQSGAMELALKDLQDSGSSVRQFIEDCCVEGENAETGRRTMFEHYTGYCSTMKLRPFSNRKFWIEMRRAIPSIVLDDNLFKTYREKRRRERVAVGVKLSDDASTYIGHGF